MGSTEAVAALAALAQTTPLEAARILVRHEPDGAPAGELARVLDGTSNTLSAHLTTLSRAGRIEGTRQAASGARAHRVPAQGLLRPRRHALRLPHRRAHPRCAPSDLVQPPCLPFRANRQHRGAMDGAAASPLEVA